MHIKGCRQCVNNIDKIGDVKVVNDINTAISELKHGNKIARFEYGNSLMPILESGEYCIVEPIKNIEDVKVGDVVVCNVSGHPMTHMVMMVSDSSSEKPFFSIGDTSLHFYGWTSDVYGIARGTSIVESPNEYVFVGE